MKKEKQQVKTAEEKPAQKPPVPAPQKAKDHPKYQGKIV